MRLNKSYRRDGVTIDIKALKRRLSMPISEFAAEIPMFGGAEEIKGEKYTSFLDSRYFFRDNHSKVLAVAHLDTALYLKDIESFTYNGFPTVISPMLDDRLGVYILLDVLPQLGIKPDILLTVGEETCCSTAANFVTKKKYNWGFSFDRRGDDVVMYQYSEANWRSALEAAGYKIGLGSYSDVRELDELGCKFANIGCGYDNEHTFFCMADLRETTAQIAKFKEFYETFFDLRFPHTYTASSWSRWGNYGTAGNWGNYGKFSDDMDMGQSATAGILDEYPYGSTVKDTTGKIIAYCLNCKVRLLQEEIDDGVCKNCLLREGAGVETFEVEGDWFTKQPDGSVVDSNGEYVCALCYADLYPEESIICEDCWEWEQKKNVRTEEVEDDDG